MDDVWTTRDLPVLDAVVRQLDVRPGFVEVAEVVEATGLDAEQVGRAFAALTRNGYMTSLMSAGSRYPTDAQSVGERAYRAVGAWPTPESLAAQLEAAFRAAAAAEPDPEKRTKLQAVLGAFSGIGRAVTTDVLTQVVEHQIGLG